MVHRKKRSTSTRKSSHDPYAEKRKRQKLLYGGGKPVEPSYADGGKRFLVEMHSVSGGRYRATVTDRATGQKWTDTHWDDAVFAWREVEVFLPLAYFREKHGEHAGLNAFHEWSGHHVMKTFILPVIVVSVIGLLFMKLVGLLG